MKKIGKVYRIFEKRANKKSTNECFSIVDFPIDSTFKEVLKIHKEKYSEYPLFEYTLYENQDGMKIAKNERRVK